MLLRKLLVALIGLVISLPAAAATENTVAQVARAIETHYFDPTKAKQIADQLRTAAQSGEFAHSTEPRALAAQLTARLRPIDRHFRVTWAAPGPKQAEKRRKPVPPQLDDQTMDRRDGYGFHRVEMLPGAVGYIDLRSFADFSYDDPQAPARKAADAALRLISGADAVIIDLRNNGGGAPAMVGYLVSAFTKPDANIYNVFHWREGTESERPKVPYAKPMLETPLYVLISGGTGSAAEAAAYTLQVAKRAVIVGEPSSGAANPGAFFPLEQGFAVFIATGSPINAVSGTNWEGVGVKPEISVPEKRALQRAQTLALEAVLARFPNRAESVDAKWVLEAARAAPSPEKDATLATYSGVYGEARIFIQHGKLQFKRARHPEWILVRLNGDMFFAQDDPARRLRFERDAAGAVKGFEVQFSSGQSFWYAK